MSRLFNVSAAALLAMVALPALAQMAPHGTGLDDGGGPPMGMDGSPPPMPPGGHHGPDPFANLPKPLAPDAVRKALEDQFSRRPHVGQIVDRDDKTLMVEIVNPDGHSMMMLVDKQTGARQPLR